MRKLKGVLLLFVAGTLRAVDAGAQACLGLPSFAGGSVHLNAAGEFPDSARAYAVGIGAGKHNELFANLGGGQITYEGLDGKSTFGFLEFGKQFPVSRAQFCPIAGGFFAAGPDDDAAGIKVTARAASAGVALGVPFGAGVFKVIPNAAVRYEYLSQKVDEEGVGSTSETFNSGVVDLGFGFVFFDRLGVQPLAHIPFGGRDDETTYGVFASVSFGWRAR